MCNLVYNDILEVNPKAPTNHYRFYDKVFVIYLSLEDCIRQNEMSVNDTKLINMKKYVLIFKFI